MSGKFAVISKGGKRTAVHNAFVGNGQDTRHEAEGGRARKARRQGRGEIGVPLLCNYGVWQETLSFFTKRTTT